MANEFEPLSHGQERRRTNRAAVRLEVSARERGRSALATRINDFSRHGCRLEGYGFILEGAPVWIRLPGLESLTGRIAWTDGTTAGIAFDRPLHPAVAAQFEPQAAEQHGYLPGNRRTDVPLPANDEVLTRREQIMRGIAGSDRSPLMRHKPRNDLGVAAMIERRVKRKANYRYEQRFAQPVSVSEGSLRVAGRSAEVANVSASGMMIRADIEATIGDKLVVEFEGFEPCEGRLVWRRGNEAGISLPPGSIELCAS